MPALAGCGLSNSLDEAPSFKLADKGSVGIIDYSKYGIFEGVGTKDYSYIIEDQAGLSKVVGEGIYPNSSSILRDPEYKEFKSSGKLKGKHWDFINKPEYQANFYKWATAPEDRGVKLFYTAFALEKSGHIKQAIKAYYALCVNFPKDHKVGHIGIRRGMSVRSRLIR